MDIENGVAIVTGSSSGVGAACARQLAERGCHVAINYSRNEAGARETEAACREFGVETVVVKADVANDDECRALAGAALEKWGRVDALGEQRRHHQVQSPRPAGRPLQAGLPGHLLRQHRWRLPDGPRRRPGHEARRTRQHRQRRLHRRGHRRWQFHCLRGVEGRDGHAHALPGACVGAGDPRQRGVSGVHPGRLAGAGLGQGALRGGQGCARSQHSAAPHHHTGHRGRGDPLLHRRGGRDHRRIPCWWTAATTSPLRPWPAAERSGAILRGCRRSKEHLLRGGIQPPRGFDSETEAPLPLPARPERGLAGR